MFKFDNTIDLTEFGCTRFTKTLIMFFIIERRKTTTES